VKLVKWSESDREIFENSRRHAVKDLGGGLVRFTFGAHRVDLTEEAARDFLHELAEFCARIDLRDFENFGPDLEESYEALSSLLRESEDRA
jgi:hypothetical protein